MNREILFRGKRINDGAWIFGSYLTCLEYDEKTVVHAIFNWSYADKDEDAAVDPETVGQFSGLVDKNGVKIFEGDLLKTTWFVCYNAALVVCSGGCFWVSNPDGVKRELYRYIGGWEGVQAFGVEIIGNMHDNPELLEGRAEL